jgi:hypothetical protein
MTTNNDYTQPLRAGLGCKVVFSLCCDYQSVLLTKKFRVRDPRIEQIKKQLLNHKNYLDYLEIMKADE